MPNKITTSNKSHEKQFKIIKKLPVSPEICSEHDDSWSADYQIFQKTTWQLFEFNVIMAI